MWKCHYILFSELTNKQKYCNIHVREIHVKPAIRYRGNHVIGYSCDKPLTPARKVHLLQQAPAFICRLIPVYSPKHALLFDQTLKVINLIYQNNGFVFLLISDNLRANQACFKMYQRDYGSDEMFPCNHPILNEAFKSLYLLYDSTHLLKNVRSNCQAEKCKIDV